MHHYTPYTDYTRLYQTIPVLIMDNIREDRIITQYSIHRLVVDEILKLYSLVSEKEGFTTDLMGKWDVCHGVMS